MDFREKIEKTMRAIGYNAEAIAFVVEKMVAVAAAYANSAKALLYIAEGFEKYVKIPFSDKELGAFLFEIDPLRIDSGELYHELGCVPSLINYLGPEDRKLYLREKQELMAKKKLIKFQRLQTQFPYAILQSTMYRAIDRPRLEDLAKFTFKLIYTPVGGQPGYRLRRRIP